MPARAPTKHQALKASGTFNPRADPVHNKLFEQSDFFDPEDILQLKYEMLRALEKHLFERPSPVAFRAVCGSFFRIVSVKWERDGELS